MSFDEKDKNENQEYDKTKSKILKKLTFLCFYIFINSLFLYFLSLKQF